MQDPIIFAGSVRVNLDPNGDTSADADMWAALKQAGLKQMVQSLPVRSADLASFAGVNWLRQNLPRVPFTIVTHLLRVLSYHALRGNLLVSPGCQHLTLQPLIPAALHVGQAGC